MTTTDTTTDTKGLRPYNPADDDDAYAVLKNEEAFAGLAFIQRQFGAAALLRSIAELMRHREGLDGVNPYAHMPVEDVEAARTLVLSIAGEVSRIERKKARVRA